MAYVVIRVRGIPDVNRDIAHTMDLLGLNRVNHAVVVPETDSIKGMLRHLGRGRSGDPRRDDPRTRTRRRRRLRHR